MCHIDTTAQNGGCTLIVSHLLSYLRFLGISNTRDCDSVESNGCETLTLSPLASSFNTGSYSIGRLASMPLNWEISFRVYHPSTSSDDGIFSIVSDPAGAANQLFAIRYNSFCFCLDFYLSRSTTLSRTLCPHSHSRS